MSISKLEWISQRSEINSNLKKKIRKFYLFLVEKRNKDSTAYRNLIGKISEHMVNAPITFRLIKIF